MQTSSLKIKRYVFFIFSLPLFSISSFGQTAKELFKLLPEEYKIDLTDTSIDSIFNQGKYILPDGDSIETVQCNYSSEGKDHLNLYFSFPTGQSGFYNVELRTFKRKNGGLLVLYAKYGGSRAIFDQHTLKAFDISNGILVKNNDVDLPEFIATKEFLKPDAPDKVKRTRMSTGYNLYSDTPKSIEYFVFSQAISWDKWLAVEDIVFTWDGNRFVRKPANK